MLRRQYLSILALATATLLFESTLTRLLAVAQFYHFAFLVVSLALLGFGASGTLLSVIPKLRAYSIERLLAFTGVSFALGVCIAYAGVNWLPFDSYSIAWERRQIFYFVLYYLALTIPFLISGLGIGAALAVADNKSHLTYAANLFGSAFGALLAPLVLSISGVPGAVLLSALIGIMSALIMLGEGGKSGVSRSRWALYLILGVGLFSFGGLVAANMGLHSPLGMVISPYKGLSYAYQYPGSQQIYGRWNAISRVDVIENAGTRRLPGLSYQYLENPPPQLGLSIDADILQPITLTTPDAFDATAWMPEALAFSLKSGANVLVVESGGGLGVLQALAGGADEITAVIEDSTILQAVSNTAHEFDAYSYTGVQVLSESSRAVLHRDEAVFDIVYFPLTDAYRPVTSGAYSLAEDFELTVEAFEDAIGKLSGDGMLVISRWLQNPPSESLRLIATLTEALDALGYFPSEEALIAYRGIQTMTVMVKPEGWTAEELTVARDFVESRRYDWVWAPGLQLYETNRFNKLPEPIYFAQVDKLFASTQREEIYAAYPYNIKPAVDNKPFFFHFFTWSQTPEVLNTLGMTWQPFGGSGFLLLIALLALVIILSGILIVFPLVLRLRPSLQIGSDSRSALPSGKGYLKIHSQKNISIIKIFLYFALLGVAFLFIEIPLIQRWILLLGQPIYAFTTVVGILLLFSGLGSALTRTKWLPYRLAFGILVLASVLIALIMPNLVTLILGWPLWARLGAALISLAPLGILMGFPFPLGLAWLADHEGSFKWIPWAWAINGCASVIASVLAAILALSYGFALVMVLGALAYLGAGLLVVNVEL